MKGGSLIMSRLQILSLGLAGMIVLGFGLLQVIPAQNINADYASPGSPPVTFTIQWSSAKTEELTRAACFDCHSNETRYPWYATIAPVSWLVNKDINEGRQKLNFSTGGELEGGEMSEQIQRGTMPMSVYMLMHPEANLTPEQKQQLINGLLATFGAE